jgi:hypothetical protein
MDSLEVLDPERPIREADIAHSVHALMPKGACQAKIPLPLRSLYEQPFDLDLGFAKISLSQNYGSSVARQRQLLRDLAARAVKRITNAPRPRAGFSVPNLVKCSAVNPASLQQRDRAVFDFNGCVRTYVNVRALCAQIERR